jgi:hypothetical protein
MRPPPTMGKRQQHRKASILLANTTAAQLIGADTAPVGPKNPSKRRVSMRRATRFTDRLSLFQPYLEPGPRAQRVKCSQQIDETSAPSEARVVDRDGNRTR